MTLIIRERLVNSESFSFTKCLEPRLCSLRGKFNALPLAQPIWLYELQSSQVIGIFFSVREGSILRVEGPKATLLGQFPAR